MRIGIDATPLLGARTGVGTYTAELVRELSDGWPDELVASAFTWRGRDGLADAVPEGVEVAVRPVPARLLRLGWRHTRWPPVEAVSGRVDIFHATNFVLPPTSAAATALTVHDLAFLRFPDSVSSASLAYRELVPLGVARADVVLTPSSAVAEQLSDAYAGVSERVRVTPLGVEPAWFDAVPADPRWLEQAGISGPYLLAVGTLEPRKNLAALLAAYGLLLARSGRSAGSVPDLVLAGGQGWGDALDTAAIPADRVHLLGYVARADLRRLVAGAAVLAFPSRDEGFGLPPLEALASGIPVVANDIPVLREVLGSQATFCDAEDPDAFAHALESAVVDPEGTPGARRSYAAQFTWRRCAELTHQAYEEAIAARW